MFSARKGLIATAALITAAAALFCLGAAVQVKTGRLDPPQVAPYLVPGMIFVLALASVCFCLASEYSKACGRPTLWPGEIELRLSDWKQLSRWCPAVIKASFLLAILVGAYTLFAVGPSVSWTTGQAFTQREALGFALFGAIMLLTLLPILASAAMMPGTYAEHFHPRLHQSTTER